MSGKGKKKSSIKGRLPSHPEADLKRVRKSGKKLMKQGVDAYEANYKGEKIENKRGDPLATGAAFPAKYFPTDPRDDFTRVKFALASTATPVAITDDDVQRILDKRSQEEKWKFDSFFQNTANPTAAKPADLRLYQQMYPEYWNDRKRVIDEQVEIQKQIAYMRLFGVQTKADMELLHRIKQGVFKLPRNPIWKLGDETSNIDETARQRGIFNPLRKKVFQQQAAYGGLSDNQIASSMGSVGPDPSQSSELGRYFGTGGNSPANRYGTI